MIGWERDPLWAKACLFFERAFNVARDDPAFGLWCSLGLELLARAALASISPALLAAPDPNHKNLLYAIDKSPDIQRPKSTNAVVVFQLCNRLFKEFGDEDFKLALALLDRRNEELHSGAAAFDEYGPGQWQAGFYRTCRSLAGILGESLATLFGPDEAEFAEGVIAESRDNLVREIRDRIAAHRREFAEKSPDEQATITKRAEVEVRDLSFKRHHRVVCPACSSPATIEGTPVGKGHVTHEEDGDIVVRQTISPTSFECPACGLKLKSYAALEVGGLGAPYTRTSKVSPEDYYGLIHPDNLESYLEEYLTDLQEYDNE